MTLSSHYLNASPSYQRAKGLGNRHVPLARSTNWLSILKVGVPGPDDPVLVPLKRAAYAAIAKVEGRDADR